LLAEQVRQAGQRTQIGGDVDASQIAFEMDACREAASNQLVLFRDAERLNEAGEELVRSSNGSSAYASQLGVPLAALRWGWWNMVVVQDSPCRDKPPSRGFAPFLLITHQGCLLAECWTL
jgi:hypothetical protein